VGQKVGTNSSRSLTGAVGPRRWAWRWDYTGTGQGDKQDETLPRGEQHQDRHHDRDEPQGDRLRYHSEFDDRVEGAVEGDRPRPRADGSPRLAARRDLGSVAGSLASSAVLSSPGQRPRRSPVCPPGDSLGQPKQTGGPRLRFRVGTCQSRHPATRDRQRWTVRPVETLRDMRETRRSSGPRLRHPIGSRSPRPERSRPPWRRRSHPPGAPSGKPVGCAPRRLSRSSAWCRRVCRADARLPHRQSHWTRAASPGRTRAGLSRWPLDAGVV